MDVFEMASRDVFASLVNDVSANNELEDSLDRELGREEEGGGAKQEEKSEEFVNSHILDILPMEHIFGFLSNTDRCALRLDVFASLIKDVSEKKELQDVQHEDVQVGQEEERAGILEILPEEMVHHIFSFLSNPDLCELRLVSQKMKMAASNPQVLQVKISQYLSTSEIESKEMSPILRNVTSMTLYDINKRKDSADEENDDDGGDDESKKDRSFEDDQTPAQVFQRLNVECTSLRRLRIDNVVIPSSLSLSVLANELAERLVSLDLENVTFNDFARFLPVAFPKLKELFFQQCAFEGDASSTFSSVDFPEIRMQHLETLHIRYMPIFDDAKFHQLARNNLSRLRDLQLAGLAMTGTDFGRLNFANLRTLGVSQCSFSDEWLSQLTHLPRLETLSLNSITFKETCSPYSFKHLTELRELTVEYCDVGNRTVAAMTRYLPNLERLRLTPNEDGTVTDEAFAGLVVHPQMEEIVFDRVQLTGTALRQLVLASPNLKELSLTICTAEDEAMEVFESLPSLTNLYLKGTRITDIGLAALESRLVGLKKFAIQSRQLTAAGLTKSLPLLTQSMMSSVNVMFGSAEECELDYHRGEPESEFPYLVLKGTSSADLLLMCLQQFGGLKSLSFDHSNLTLAEVSQLGVNQPNLEFFTATECHMSEEAAAALIDNLPSAQCFDFYSAHLSEDVLVALLRAMALRMSKKEDNKWDRLYIQNDTFPSKDSLKTVVPVVSRCNNFEICSADYEKSLKVVNTEDYKAIYVNGAGAQFDDDVVVEVAKRMLDATTLYLTKVDDGITARGIAEIAPLLHQLNTLTLQSATLDDDALAIVGRDYPPLIDLRVECERFTDVGLEALGEQLKTVETLTIKGTAITDDGIRRIASKLATVKYFAIYENSKITKELHDYMKSTYPDAQHDPFPEPEPEAEPEAEAAEIEGGQVGQLAAEEEEEEAANGQAQQGREENGGPVGDIAVLEVAEGAELQAQPVQEQPALQEENNVDELAELAQLQGPIKEQADDDSQAPLQEQEEAFQEEAARVQEENNVEADAGIAEIPEQEPAVHAHVPVEPQKTT